MEVNGMRGWNPEGRAVAINCCVACVSVRLRSRDHSQVGAGMREVKDKEEELKSDKRIWVTTVE